VTAQISLVFDPLRHLARFAFAAVKGVLKP